MDSKYRMFKNYMYNDLGITKGDIQEWTKEATREVASNYLNHHINDWNLTKLVKQGVEDTICKTAPQIIERMLREKYELKVIEKVVVTK